MPDLADSGSASHAPERTRAHEKATVFHRGGAETAERLKCISLRPRRQFFCVLFSEQSLTRPWRTR